MTSLRQWLDADLVPFAAMSADPEVMQCFLRPLTAGQSRELALRQRHLIDQRGWGLWVVDVDGDFAGFTGLAVPMFTAHFTPCVEIGWRLRKEYWGRSIAYAAAQQAMDYAFHTLQLPELVSFTATTNVRSWKLMQRLGFTHDPREDFMHPMVEEGHPLRHHVLYRKTAGEHALNTIATPPHVATI